MSGCGQPPQPQYVVQLPVSADLAGRPRGRPVVLAQELVMKPYRQHSQDLDRVVGIKLVYRLTAHTPAGYQRRQTVNPRLEARAVSCQVITPVSGRRALAALLVAVREDSKQRPEDLRLGQKVGAKV